MMVGNRTEMIEVIEILDGMQIGIVEIIIGIASMNQEATKSIIRKKGAALRLLEAREEMTSLILTRE